MGVHPAALLLAVFCAHAEIPRPTGLSKVGRTVLCWSDGSRLEAKANVDDKRPRTVLVSFFYPVQTSAAQEDASAPYVPGLDKLRTVLGDERLRAELGMPYAAATDLRVAASEVPQEQTRDKYPLLLFLPGLMHGSFKYSYQLVDLASHGYIVAAINPPGEVSAFACPDGAVVPRDMSGWGEAQQRPGLDALAFQRERNGVWAEDALFVLHQLLERKRVEAPRGVAHAEHRSRKSRRLRSLDGRPGCRYSLSEEHSCEGLCRPGWRVDSGPVHQRNCNPPTVSLDSTETRDSQASDGCRTEPAADDPGGLPSPDEPSRC